MKSSMKILLCTALALAACGKPSGYDPDASRAFRAAWEKRRAGDEAGYRAALAEVAKRKGTWAGDRAALDLELVDETRASGWGSLLQKAAELVRPSSALPAFPPSAP
jgi:hypothetical protein